MLAISMTEKSMGGAFVMHIKSILNCCRDKIDFKVRVVCFQGHLDGFIDMVMAMKIVIHMVNEACIDNIKSCSEVEQLIQMLLLWNHTMKRLWSFFIMLRVLV